MRYERRSSNFRLRRPASRRSPREAAHRQRQHRIFERLRKRSKRGRGTENRLWGVSTASLDGISMNNGDDWTEYRRRRNIFWVVVVSYVPGILAFGLSLQWLLGSELPIYLAAAAWMIAFIVAANRMTAWHCPSLR